MVRLCIICGTYKQRNDDISYHHLPTDQELREKWLQAICQWKEEFVLPKDAFVCSNHFDPKFFCMQSGRRRLTKGAVPTFKYKAPKDFDTDDTTTDSSEVNMVEASVNYDSDTRDSTEANMVEESDPLDNKSLILTRTLHEPHSNSPLSLMKEEYERKLEEAYYNNALLNSKVLEQHNKILDLQLTVKNLQNEKKSTDAVKCLFMYRNGELVRMEINSSDTDENK